MSCVYSILNVLQAVHELFCRPVHFTRALYCGLYTILDLVLNVLTMQSDVLVASQIYTRLLQSCVVLDVYNRLACLKMVLLLRSQYVSHMM